MSEAIHTLREKLHYYIDNLEDKKVKAFYTIVQSDIEDNSSIYTAEYKAELDKRLEDFKTGRTKMIAPDESRKRIQKIIKEKSNK